MYAAGFEPTNPARERLQTQALDRPATGIGRHYKKLIFFWVATKMLSFPK